MPYETIAGTYVVAPLFLRHFADALDGDKMSQAEEDRLNATHQENVARLKALCAGVDARLGDLTALRPAAPEVESLGVAIGDATMSPAMKACVGFHAEALGHWKTAYRLYFGAAIASLYERDWIAERLARRP